ncbi:AfsR/SARP family transcriptional regulator [Streptomyces celluloflavus]|uniref:AfsR/SARP family transcriptional regulator n=1 Tax=Streptomyces celluloflavus TaxID=58344 RepID=UPI00368D800A
MTTDRGATRYGYEEGLGYEEGYADGPGYEGGHGRAGGHGSGYGAEYRSGERGPFRFQVLGSVRVLRDGQALNAGSPQQRVVLAMLLLRGGRAVPVWEMVDALWEQAPPKRAMGTVRTYVSRLRTLLEPERGARAPARLLVSEGDGYALRTPVQALDAAEFEARLADAARLRSGGDTRGAYEELSRALGLWGGTPLAGLSGPYPHMQRERLTELRVTAQENAFACALELGRASEVVASLRAFATEQPLRERTQGLLMRALDQSGRRADALAVYEATRRFLDTELGIRPGRELGALHARLLSGAPATRLAQPQSQTQPQAQSQTQPRTERRIQQQRQPRIPVRTGRSAESAGPDLPVPAQRSSRTRGIVTPARARTTMSAPATRPDPRAGRGGGAVPAPGVPRQTPPRGAASDAPPAPGTPAASLPSADSPTSPDSPAARIPGASAPPCAPRPQAPSGIPARQPAASAQRIPVPAQLPSAMADFAGRRELAAGLHELLDGAAAGRAPVVAVLTGLGGAGKTALAVHVAQQARARFPDGQLYVDLHGCDPVPADTADVLTRFLSALGVPDSALPDGLDQLAALYRSLLAGRRMLILLDSAKDAAQIRPLLPGTPGCAVLVTSRSRTIALSGARTVEVGVLEEAEGVGLLAAVLGRDRVAAERCAARELVADCGGLPLALRIAAARLAARPGRTLADLAARLRDERRRLDELRVGDLAVHATFRIGYEALDPELARTFRILALADMPSFCRGAAAVLLGGISEDEAEERVERLVDAGLLECQGTDRYHYHGLVRLFARRLSERTDSPRERCEARRRFLDFVLATVLEVVRNSKPHSVLPSLLHRPAMPGRALLDAASSREWLDDADARLYAFVDRVLRYGPGPADGAERRADGAPEGDGCTGPAGGRHRGAGGDAERAGDAWAAGGEDAGDAADADECPGDLLRQAVDLLTAWSHLLGGTARHRGLEPLARLALERARWRGDDVATARALRLLGAPGHGSQTYERSARMLRESLRLAERAGDRLVGAEAAHELAMVLLAMGRAGEALPVLGQAYTRFEALGARADAIRVRAHLARAYLVLGQRRQGYQAMAEALASARQLGCPETTAQVLYQTGCGMLADGRAGEAAAHLREAQRHHRCAGNPRWEALAWARLAHCELARGRDSAALDCAAQALAIERDLGDDVCRGLAQAARGRALLALGDTAGAHHALESARSALRRRGAHQAAGIAELLAEPLEEPLPDELLRSDIPA